MSGVDVISLKDKIFDISYRIISCIIHYVLAFVYWFSSKKVPPIKNPILLMSATDLAKKIRERKITSETVVRTFIERILEVEPFINAVVDHRFEEALKEAKKADAFVAWGVLTKEQLEKEKPLLGVPFSIKNFIKVKGLRCTAGSVLFKDYIPDEDAIVVDLMKKAGAIALVTTNVPEVGTGIQSSNYVRGTTCNPYDTSRTSGGSSGGESAIISAAGTPIGIGNDMAGSIRIPSMFTGIFGHMPSKGIVSNEGLFPPINDKLDELLATGPMCRYAEDLVTMMKILAPTSDITTRFGKQVDFKTIKVYYMLSFGDDIPFTEKVDLEIQDAVKKVVHFFEVEKGCQVQQIAIPQVKHGFQAHLHTMLSYIPDLGKTLTAGTKEIDGISEILKYIFLQSKHTLVYLIALNAKKLSNIYDPNLLDVYTKLLNGIDSQLNNILDDNSILVLPTMPFPAPYHNEMILRFQSIVYTSMFNIFRMPCTQCPTGFTKKGLPVGVQILGRRGNDHLTLASGVEIQTAFGGWKPPGL